MSLNKGSFDEFFDVDESDLPPPEFIKYHPKNEGIDHINIYSKSKIEVGRQLSNFYHSPFIIDGETFQSVEGYWYWLKTGRTHNILKDLWGYQAKQVGETFSKVEFNGFNQKITEAIKLKLENNKKIKENFTNSSLPFTHYYCYGSTENPKIHDLHKKYEWLIQYFTDYRIILKNKYYLNLFDNESKVV